MLRTRGRLEPYRPTEETHSRGGYFVRSRLLATIGVAVAISLTACGGGSPSASQSTNSSPAASTQPAAATTAPVTPTEAPTIVPSPTQAPASTPTVERAEAATATPQPAPS